jgi:hypothetical protein
VRLTCDAPAVADTTGVETKGKYKKPPKSLRVDDVEDPIAICDMTELRPKLVDVEYPPGKIVGSETL